jgi:TATA-box binding protein (TBP) (component of TFIID and TFIIIB)
MTTKIFLIFAPLLILGCWQISQEHTQKKSGDLKGVSDTFNSPTDSGLDSTSNGFIIPVGSLGTARAVHTATLLKNGKVLICGGFTGSTLSSAEIYDATSKVFKYVGKMSVARAGHSATLLPDGKVLIAGGYNGNYLSSTEIFDLQTQTFSAGPIMNSPRSGHTATLLNNGKILFAGGVGVSWSFLESAELYDIQTKKFSPTGSMTTARESHTATLIKNGNVLITGGHKGRRTDIKIYSRAEIYDPISEKFRLIGNMTKIRHKHDAVMLANGRVLITGGSDERDSKGAYSSAELYDPVSFLFKPVKNMNLTRYKHNATSILLTNNNILIAGGANQAEIYNPESGEFTIVKERMGSQRLFSCATLLSNGQILITGGYNENQEASANAWIYILKK